MIADLADPPAIVCTPSESVPGAPGNGTDRDDEAVRQAWTKVASQMSELRRLQHDWDGEGGRTPDTALLDSVSEFLRQRRERKASPPCRVIATPDGVIVLEWQSPGLVETLEISRPYEGDLFSRRSGYASELRTVTWRRQAPDQPTYLFDQRNALSIL